VEVGVDLSVECLCGFVGLEFSGWGVVWRGVWDVSVDSCGGGVGTGWGGSYGGVLLNQVPEGLDAR